MIGHDDPHWHTNLDTPDHVDSTRLKHVALLAGALAAVPSLDPTEHRRLADWVYAYSVRELAGAMSVGRELSPSAGLDLLETAIGIEQERFKSLASLGIDAVLLEPFRILLATLADLYRSEWSNEGPQAERLTESANRPRRIVDGPLVYSVTDRFNDEERAFFKDELSANHRALIEGLLNLSDGTLTTREIARRLTLDVGSPVEQDVVEKGAALLRKARYLA
jgi:hypothetical protein